MAQKAEAGGVLLSARSALYCNFQACKGYIMRLYFSNNNNNKKKKRRERKDKQGGGDLAPLSPLVDRRGLLVISSKLSVLGRHLAMKVKCRLCAWPQSTQQQASLFTSLWGPRNQAFVPSQELKLLSLFHLRFSFRLPSFLYFHGSHSDVFFM